ncbi:hypothetical protein Tco_0143407 [Tanacetum coccineum]
MKKVLVEVLAERLTDQKEVGAIVEEEEDNWMTTIIRCLADGVWPIDKDERRALRMLKNLFSQVRKSVTRTSLKQSNGETPFSLTYRSEAVIPAEIGMPTHRTLMIKEDENEDELRLNMDLLQERREAATIREAKHKTKMK